MLVVVIIVIIYMFIKLYDKLTTYTREQNRTTQSALTTVLSVVASFLVVLVT